MPYAPTTWQDRIVQNPLTYDVTNNPDGSITLVPKPGTVTQEGILVDAARLNNMEQGIVNAAEASALNTHLADLTAHGLGNVPACRVYHSVDQSIPNNTTTALAFNSERYDTESIHDTSTNNSRLTCVKAGKYSIKGNVAFAGNNTGGRSIRIRLNGTTNIAITQIMSLSNGSSAILSVCTDYNLSPGDYVELIAFQDSGGALSVASFGNYSPEFMMVKVG